MLEKDKIFIIFIQVCFRIVLHLFSASRFYMNVQDNKCYYNVAKYEGRHRALLPNMLQVLTSYKENKKHSKLLAKIGKTFP